MLVTNVLAYTLSALSLLVPASASPTNASKGKGSRGKTPSPVTRPQTPEVKEVKCHPVNWYTTEWFIKDACRKPKKTETCLFYTRGLTNDARAYAKKNNELIMIWDIWALDLYDLEDRKDNPLRCFGKNKDDMRTYFASMSRAMASLCYGPKALVMDRDTKYVFVSSIWGMVEFPRLWSNTRKEISPKVDIIDAIDLNGKNEQRFWTREKKNEGKKGARDVEEGGDEVEEEGGDEVEEEEGLDVVAEEEDTASAMTETGDETPLAKRSARKSSCGKVGLSVEKSKQFDQGGKWPIDW